MNQALVSLKNGIPSTTSLKVAEVFHKRHDAVIRDIRKLKDNTPESFHAHNFVEMFNEVSGANGAIRKYPMYTMTRDGFTLLVMGYTGKDAMRFKLEYIEAFNAMEKELMRRQNTSLTPADRSDLKALVDAKLSTCPAHLQGKARSELWARFNRHFRIAEYAQLPQEKMAEARDYIVELELRALRPRRDAESSCAAEGEGFEHSHRPRRAESRAEQAGPAAPHRAAAWAAGILHRRRQSRA